MRNRWLVWLLAAATGAAGLLPCESQAAREAKKRPGAGPKADAAGGTEAVAAGGGDEAPATDMAARRLFKRAEELLAAGETERGVKMLETVLDQYPGDPIKYSVHLALGKHHMATHQETKAIEYLRLIEPMQKPDVELQGDDRELYLEGVYTMGVCYFQTRQYGKAFAALRRITNKYPNTVWSNQAYYYIGMSHFAQEHWNKAILSLGMVGTFVDPNSPLLEFVEAGHRFHAKVTDRDLPLLARLKKDIAATATTKAGDKETIPCEPLAGQDEIYLGSLPTVAGTPVPNDGKLQVIGGDTIEVTYVDDNTKEGNKDVPRKRTVKVVSSASMSFTLATFDQRAVAAFLGQPIFLRVKDLDADKSDAKNTVTVRLTSRFKSEEKQVEAAPTATVDIEKLLAEEEKSAFTIRDEVTLELVEDGESTPVHTGIFHGSLVVKRFNQGQSVDTSDQALECAVGDDLVATYVDEVHAAGSVPVEITDKLVVAGEIDSRPRSEIDVVPDPIVKSKKELVEAEAFLELAKIFKSMGLSKTAAIKSEEGLDKVKFTLQTDSPIPNSLKERAFKLSWDLYLAKDDFQSAMATCEAFNLLYPESPMVSDALMGIAMVFKERGDFAQAKTVLRRVLGLPNSFAKAEAQYRIGEITETEGVLAAEAAAKRGGRGAAAPAAPAAVEEGGTVVTEAAMAEYKTCALRYPDSEYAGLSLGKVIDFHIQTKDYTIADDLLEQIFMDYRDEDFLDGMLLKWVIVAYRMGNLEKARDKCQQLIFEFPGSRYAPKGKSTLEKIEARLGKGGASSEG
jgi:TolA-binding protein